LTCYYFLLMVLNNVWKVWTICPSGRFLLI